MGSSQQREKPLLQPHGQKICLLSKGRGFILAQKLHDPVLSVLATLENLQQQCPEKGLLICFLLWWQNATQGLLPAVGQHRGDKGLSVPQFPSWLQCHSVAWWFFMLGTRGCELNLQSVGRNEDRAQTALPGCAGLPCNFCVMLS